MKHFILASAAIIQILLLSAPCLVSAQAQVPSKALGTVEYEVRYNLKNIDTKVADATISWERGTREQQPVLHSHAVIRASSIFKLFMNSEYIADSYLTPDGSEPVYFLNPIKKGSKEGKFECIYNRKDGTVRSEFVRPPADPVVNTYTFDGRTMEILSLLTYVRFLDIPAGASRSMHLMMGKGDFVAATLTNQGIDKERFPGVETERLRLKMTGRGVMENGSGDEIVVWRTTGSDRSLVGLETVLNSGVMTVTVKGE